VQHLVVAPSQYQLLTRREQLVLRVVLVLLECLSSEQLEQEED